MKTFSFLDDGHEIPLVTAVLGTTGLEFHCPRCSEPLSLARVELQEIIRCPIDDCATQMRVATRRQVKALQENKLAQDRRNVARARQTLRRGGTIPDRITVVGRASSGKTVYFAMLYQSLFGGCGAVQGCATSGREHTDLLSAFATLQGGDWLPATLRNTPIEIELEYQRARMVLSSLDFSGELMREVIYDMSLTTPMHHEVYRHIEHSLGTIILLDPLQMIRRDPKYLDAQFTAIEVLRRLESRGMGYHAVLVLTKRNENKWLIDSYGGVDGFLRTVAPRLYQMQRSMFIPVLHVAAVSIDAFAEGGSSPAPRRADLVEVQRPLVALLNRIDPAYIALLSLAERRARDASIEHEATNISAVNTPEADR